MNPFVIAIIALYVCAGFYDGPLEHGTAWQALIWFASAVITFAVLMLTRP